MFNMAHLNKEPYVSCIKINGVPVLPPLITNGERQSLLNYKIKAIAIEEKLKKQNGKQKTNTKCSSKLKHIGAGANKLKSSASQNVEQILNSVIKTSSPCRSPRCHKMKRLKNTLSSDECLDSKVPVEEIPTPRKHSIRRDSYTLESPTPEILEQLYALQSSEDQRLYQKESIQDLLNIKKNQCLKHLNQMNLGSQELHGNTNHIAQEKLFIENLPANFFELNEKVLSASRNQTNLCENKLTESIHLATTLLNSINTSADNVRYNNAQLNTIPTAPSCCKVESTVRDSITEGLLSRTVPCESKTISESSHISTATSISPMTPQTTCQSTQTHRHRRAWNLKQAKRLWENEELKFPTRECCSEPASRGRTPPLLYYHSYSLDCLHNDNTSIFTEDLQTPTGCLERSEDTLVTCEDHVNLYSYYLNLFKDMSEYVTQQGELLSPGDLLNDSKVAFDYEKSETLFNFNQPTIFQHSNDVEISSHASASISELVNYNPAENSFDLIQFSNPSDESFSNLEIPDNVDNLEEIEKFLLGLQRSQEREMELLLRKQQEEQLWLKQKQEKLKECVLSLSQSSSAMSSLNSSVNLTRSGGESSICDPCIRQSSNNKEIIEEDGKQRAIVDSGKVSNKSTPSQNYDSCEEWFTPETDKLSPVSDVPTAFIHEDTTHMIDEDLKEDKVTCEHQLQAEKPSASDNQYSLELRLSQDNSEHWLDLENQHPVQEAQTHSAKQSTDRILKDIANMVLEVDNSASISKFDSTNTRDNFATLSSHGTETYQTEWKQIHQGIDSLSHGLDLSPVPIEFQKTEHRIPEIRKQAHVTYSTASDNFLNVSSEKNINSPLNISPNIIGDAWPEFDCTNETVETRNVRGVLHQSSSMKTAPQLSSTLSAATINDCQKISSFAEDHVNPVQSYKTFNSMNFLRTLQTSHPALEISSSPSSLDINSSVPMSLDLVKQKYLLRPDVMRSQGLQGFETNVISRLQREVSSRPKSLIRETYTEREQQAAFTLTAAARGYLVRRLLRTQRVQHIKATIQDTLKCALSLQSDPSCVVSSSDLELHTRLIHQLTAACYELYDTFFSLNTREKMNIISQDRERQRNIKMIQMRILAKKTQSKPASEPRRNITGATKTGKKNTNRVKRSKSVSSQDTTSVQSNESPSNARNYSMSRSQSNSQPVPNLRRRLVLS